MNPTEPAVADLRVETYGELVGHIWIGDAVQERPATPHSVYWMVRQPEMLRGHLSMMGTSLEVVR